MFCMRFHLRVRFQLNVCVDYTETSLIVALLFSVYEKIYGVISGGFSLL